MRAFWYSHCSALGHKFHSGAGDRVSPDLLELTMEQAGLDPRGNFSKIPKVRDDGGVVMENNQYPFVISKILLAVLNKVRTNRWTLL